MRSRISVVIITAALLCGVSDLRAGLNFQHDRTFTIPGLSGPIRQMKFNDANLDSIPEVLACDTSRAILYSIARDSILFTYIPDSGYFISAVEYADVDRDSVPDVVVAVACDSGFNFTYLITWRILVFSALSGDVAADTIVLSLWPAEPYFHTPHCCLSALPDYSDGYNRLLFSALELQMWDWSSSWHELVTVGRTKLYWSFPDSVSRQDSIHIAVATTAVSASSRVTTVIAKYTRYEQWAAGQVMDDRWEQTLLLLTKEDSMISLTEPFIPPCYSSSSLDECLLIGELDFDTSTVEVLASRLESKKCSSGGSTDTTRYLQTFRIDAANNSQLMWSHEFSGAVQTGFVYHPNLPGYFFAFSGDTLVLFRGSDGSVQSKLIDVPTGTRYWDYPYGDGIPRLIVTNGTQVSFYNLDVTTGADDEPSHSLPSAFAIGQPYPNPFNAELTIPITLSKSQDVAVDVFNIVGERVVRLHEGKGKAGENLIRWDATGVSSGIYLIRARSAGETRTVKAVLLK